MLGSYRIIIIAAICVIPVTGVFAATSPEKGEWWVKTSPHATSDHPPHDHQHHDHIKKLDEAMRRKRKDEEKSH